MKTIYWVYVGLVIFAVIFMAILPFLIFIRLHVALAICWLILLASLVVPLGKRFIRPMITNVIWVVTFLGDILGVYSKLSGADGMLSSGFIFSVPFLMGVYRFPTPMVRVEYMLAGDYVKDDEGNPLPVIVIIQFQFALSDSPKGMLSFIQGLDVLGETDLTKIVDMDEYDMDTEEKKLTSTPYQTPCLARVVKHHTEGPIDDAVSRILCDYEIIESVSNIPEIEEKLKKDLAGNTIFGEAGLLSQDKDVGFRGPAVRRVKFNVRHIALELTNKMAGPFVAKLEAQAEAHRGKGLRDRLNAEKEAGLTPQQALAARVAEKNPNITVVTSESVLDALANKVIGS